MNSLPTQYDPRLPKPGSAKRLLLWTMDQQIAPRRWQGNLRQRMSRSFANRTKAPRQPAIMRMNSVKGITFNGSMPMIFWRRKRSSSNSRLFAKAMTNGRFLPPRGVNLDRTEGARFVPTSLWQDLTPVEWILRKMGRHVSMQTATWLTSRELAEAAGRWDTRLHVDDDGEYFCRTLLLSKGTRFVPEARVYYRDTSSNRVSHVGASYKKEGCPPSFDEATYSVFTIT